MNKRIVKLFLLGLFAGAMISLMASGWRVDANSSGPPLSRTGAPAIGSFTAEQTCATSSCHGSFALNSGPGTMTITGLPAFYVPDQEIPVTVTVSQANRVSYGFQLTVLDSSGNRAGTLVQTDTTRTQLSTATAGVFAGRRYIQQSFNGISANGTNQASWTFTWRAPSQPSGKITFYAAGNAANGGGSSAQDYIYTTSASIDPAPTATSVSAASYSTTATMTSEMITSLFSVGLASGVLAATAGQPLPTTLGDTVVELTDSTGKVSNAPLFFVSSAQINYLIPPNTTEGIATVRVRRSGNIVSFGNVSISRYSPGLFTANASGTGIAAAQVLRRSVGQPDRYENVARFNATTGTSEPAPVDLGAESDLLYLVLYGTGLRGISSQTAGTLTLGGRPLPVLFVGATPGFFGLDQVVAGPVPRDITKGALDVVFSADNKTANTVSVSIK